MNRSAGSPNPYPKAFLSQLTQKRLTSSHFEEMVRKMCNSVLIGSNASDVEQTSIYRTENKTLVQERGNVAQVAHSTSNCRKENICKISEKILTEITTGRKSYTINHRGISFLARTSCVKSNIQTGIYSGILTTTNVVVALQKHIRTQHEVNMVSAQA